MMKPHSIVIHNQVLPKLFIFNIYNSGIPLHIVGWNNASFIKCQSIWLLAMAEKDFVEETAILCLYVFAFL